MAGLRRRRPRTRLRPAPPPRQRGLRRLNTGPRGRYEGIGRGAALKKYGDESIAEATKILEVPRELVGPCLADAVAAEEIVRERVPTAGGEVPPVYLLPFHRAERSLAGGLLDLLHAKEDRLPGFRDVGWDKALAWAGVSAPSSPRNRRRRYAWR